VAIGFLVLDAIGFFERGERRAVDRSRRNRHLQFEGLALIVQGGGAFQSNLLLGKTVFGQRRPSVGFKLAEERIDFRLVDRTEQCLSRSCEVIGDLGIEQTIRREDTCRRRDQDPAIGGLPRMSTIIEVCRLEEALP
jgi:hypothetical protein